MSRLLLQGLLTFLALALLGPIQLALGVRLAAIDVPATVVVYLALVEPWGRQRSVTGGNYGLFRQDVDWGAALTVVVVGYLADLFGGGLRGLHAFSLATLYLNGRLLSRRLVVRGMFAEAVFVFCGALYTSAIALTLRWIIGTRPDPGIALVLLAHASLTALVSPLTIKALRTIDHTVYRRRLARGVT
jgi:hypothetical protein